MNQNRWPLGVTMAGWTSQEGSTHTVELDAEAELIRFIVTDNEDESTFWLNARDLTILQACVELVAERVNERFGKDGA